MVVGRCGEEVLKKFPNLISVFIRADRDFRKIRLIAEGRAENLTDADKKISPMDRARRTYHNRHCVGKWGEAETYGIFHLSLFVLPSAQEHPLRSWALGLFLYKYCKFSLFTGLFTKTMQYWW